MDHIRVMSDHARIAQIGYKSIKFMTSGNCPQHVSSVIHDMNGAIGGDHA